MFSDAQVGLFYGDQLVDKTVRRPLPGGLLAAQRTGLVRGERPAPTLAGNTPDTTLYGWTDGACEFGDRLLITKRGKYCAARAQ